MPYQTQNKGKENAIWENGKDKIQGNGKQQRVNTMATIWQKENKLPQHNKHKMSNLKRTKYTKDQ